MLFAHFHYEETGTHDFVQYWTAYHVASDGLDPYLPAHLEALNRSLGRAGAVLMCWGPPWLLAILAPLLELPFDVAGRCSFLMNALFLMAAASVTARIYYSDVISGPTSTGSCSTSCYQHP